MFATTVVKNYGIVLPFILMQVHMSQLGVDNDAFSTVSRRELHWVVFVHRQCLAFLGLIRN